MLDIIITHYKEPWEVCRPMFEMLALQRGIGFDQFRVIFVNDGPENHILDELLCCYPYHVNQIDIPHGGVSAARNAGLEYASAEWVNFCDCDDTYSNIYAIRDVLNILNQPVGYDVLWTHLLTEDFINGKNTLIVTPEKSTFVFIHGKYYRRQWLLDNGLRFNTDFKFQEDSLFNALVLAVAKTGRVGQIRTLYPPYVWCRRDGSVTNTDKNADRPTWYHFRRNCAICEFYRDNLPEDRLRDMVVRTTYDAFFMLCSKTDITEEMRNQILHSFQEFIREYGKYYALPKPDILKGIQEISAAELMMRPINSDFDVVTEWKDLLEGVIN